MKKTSIVLLCLLCLLVPYAAAEQTDSKGCQDHPMFTRMPTYWIHGCDLREFAAYTFNLGKGKTETVEGQFTKLRYYPQAAATSKPSELQIMRNFEAAVQKLGGTSYGVERGKETFKIVKDGKEVWVELWAEFTGKYGLTIVEREAMKQDIEATAAVLAEGLRGTGHIAVDGTLFDTGKTELKPESLTGEPLDAQLRAILLPVYFELNKSDLTAEAKETLDRIAAFLDQYTSVSIRAEGHADEPGDIQYNWVLGDTRARAVQTYLITMGLAADRIQTVSYGKERPAVQCSDADEVCHGKNRRVEWQVISK